MKSWATKILMLLFLIASPVALAHQDLDSIPVRGMGQLYQCPPCGCAHDGLVFTSPGACAKCGMPMIPALQGNKKVVDNVVRETFKTGVLQKWYTKLMYPVFLLGILTAFFLIFKTIRYKKANPYLSGVLLVISLYAFKNQLYGVNYGLTNSFQSLFTPISFITALGPLLFFYFKSKMVKTFSWKKKYWIHFAPAMLFFIYYAFLFVAPDSIKQQFMPHPFEVSGSHLEQGLAIASSIVYLICTIPYFSNTTEVFANSSWLKRFFVINSVFILTWAFLLILNFINYDLGVATVSYNILWVASSIYLAWIIIEILINPKYFLSGQKNSAFHFPQAMSKDELSSISEKIYTIMDTEQVYLSADYGLDELSASLSLNRRYVSNILNNYLNTSFYELINSYRIETAKKILLNPDYSHFTIEAIANHAGFKSKSSFNSSFKKIVGMTPSQYIKSASAEHSA